MLALIATMDERSTYYNVYDPAPFCTINVVEWIEEFSIIYQIIFFL